MHPFVPSSFSPVPSPRLWFDAPMRRDLVTIFAGTAGGEGGREAEQAEPPRRANRRASGRICVLRDTRKTQSFGPGILNLARLSGPRVDLDGGGMDTVGCQGVREASASAPFASPGATAGQDSVVVK